MVLFSDKEQGAAPYYLPLAIFPLLAAAALYGGLWIAGPLAFLLANSLDPVFGSDERNISPNKISESKLFWFKLSIWTWAVLWPVTLVFVLWQILVAGSLSNWERVVLVVVMAMTAPLVYMISHEFIHRRAAWERRVAEFLLASVSYPLYAIEHVYIHHARVGTPGDPESAPRGTSFWQFFASGLPRSLVTSWRYECNRLARREHPPWHISNIFWRYLFLTVAWYALGWWMGGWRGVLIFIIMGASVVFQMRLSDYIQHYGLRRVKLPDGRFERVRPHHVWGASYRLANWLYYNAQRHPDHHAVASRHYPVLQHHGEDTAPQLPGTYSSMMGLAVFPQRWFEKMNPLVDQQRERFYPQIEDWSAYDSDAFAARPEAFDAISEILAAAPVLACWMNRSPKLLDSLESKEFTNLELPNGFGTDPEFETTARRGLARVYWTHELGLNEMKEQLAEFPAQNAREMADTAREWSNYKAFQICTHAIRTNLTAAEARTAASRVVEAAISAVVTAVCEDVSERIFQRHRSGIGIVTFGDLANRGRILGSELNLLFLYEGESTKYNGRLWPRLRKALQIFSHNNLLIAPLKDIESELPAQSFSTFLEHYSNDNSMSKLLKIASGRLVFMSGDADITARFESVQQEILTHNCASGALRSNLNQTVRGLTKPSLESIQDMEGGLLDVERAALLLKLKYASELPEFFSADSRSVFEATGERGLVPKETAQRLADAAILWHNLSAILSLVTDEGFDAAAASAKIKAFIAKAAGLEDFPALVRHVREIASQTAIDIELIQKVNKSAH